ncbi:MAG: FAD-dependent thymidylate synthase [Anaerolineaceae bacterium]|nr:FAD-dependent thymidylate synthase [Anaerolineaceae bacterium]
MLQHRQIYLLDTKELSPETIAVTFAKTSRSSKSFNEIAAELSEKRSADFHEKWVVGYGHSSVAEHAVLHIAVENISRLAVECLESNRLASYTEKSSRYQIWDEDHFFIPEEIQGSEIKEKYLKTCKLLFKEYQIALSEIREYLSEVKPRQNNESDRSYANRIHTCSADVCRYYLPTSSLANVGVTINARALEHALQKMLSHPLSEIRKIGEEIKIASLKKVPTLIKYAYRNDYLAKIEADITKQALKIVSSGTSNNAWCECVDDDEDGELKILAALLYRFSDLSYQDAYAYISQQGKQKIKRIAETLLNNLGKHDIPAREMEYTQVGFDLIIDQGAYFELKRHRMMTQTVKPFSPQLGYAVPKSIRDAGLLKNFTTAMEMARETFQAIYEIHPHAAAYILPNAYNRRILIKMNLRTALHLIKLRSAPNAHFAMRRAAQGMAEVIRNKYPLFSPYFKIDTDETSQTLEKDFFIKTS